MNQHRRIRGSLLERAADMYDFGHPPKVAPKHAPQEAEAKAAPAPAPKAAAAPSAAPKAAPAVPAAPPVAAEPEAPVAGPEIAPEVQANLSPVVPRIRRGAEIPAEPVASATSYQTVAVDRAKLAENGLLVPGAPVDALAEEFRLIKRQLLRTTRVVEAVDAARARMILVCSAKPNEGKTFSALNLALSMAMEQDFEILLVDADFPKPDVMQRLGLSERQGLLDVLANASMDVESCVVQTDVPKLSILSAGTKSSNDTELLASDRAHHVLERLVTANPRRIVIFDSPPVLAASPAGVLAQYVGQAMLVVRADRTTESDLREAVSLLDGCEHVQLVLNSVTYNPGGRRFGSYYGQESAA